MMRWLGWSCVLWVRCGAGDVATGGPAEGEAEAEAEAELPGCDGAAAPAGASGLAGRLAAGQVRAGRIADPGELLGGDAADGRVGDFKLYNDRVAFVIQSERPGDNYVPYGGHLIDADLVREPGEWGEDRIDEYAAAFWTSPFSAEEVCVVADGADGGPAIVRAVGIDDQLPLVGGFIPGGTPPWNLRVSTDYVLRPDDDALEIVTTALSSFDYLIQTGDFILMSDDGMDPFTIGPGFDRARLLDVAAFEMVGVLGEDQHLAYGFFADAPLRREPVITDAVQALAGDDIAVFFPVREIAFPAGRPASFRRFVAVGRDLDALNRARWARWGTPDLAALRGTVTDGRDPIAGARVHVLDPAQDPPAYVTSGRTGADGGYRLQVPAGAYRVIATGSDIGQDVEVPVRPAPDGGAPFAHGHGGSAPAEVTVAPGAEALADLALSPTGRLTVELRDAAGAPAAGKVILAFARGVDPTPPDPILGERHPYGYYHQFWTVDGSITADVEPGRYRVTGFFGLHRELADDEVTVPARGEATVVLDDPTGYADYTAGWLQGDLHLHGGPSIHGEITREQRVVAAIAEGLHFYAASEHDRVIDYQPVVDRLGLTERIGVMASNEISTFRSGHFNPYPLDPAPDEPNQGATAWFDGLLPCQMWADARAHGADLIQVNHGTGTGGYFDAMGFDWLTGQATSADWCPDFDAMEIVNGKSTAAREDLLRVYYGLLNAGKVVTPTGVSDSHHRIPEAGMGRTFVKMEAPFAPDGFVTAMRAHRTQVSTGGFLDVVATSDRTDEAAGPGETLTTGAGTVTLRIRAYAPSWIPLETVQLVERAGCPDERDACTPRATWEVAPDGAPLWLDTSHDLEVGEDTWLVVRADGTSDLAPAYPGAVPFVSTAAILIDVVR